MQSSGYSWCDRCGAHSWFRKHMLSKQCWGEPANGAQASRLNFLRAGGSPYGVWIGAPRRLRIAEVAGLEASCGVVLVGGGCAINSGSVSPLQGLAS